MDIAKIRRLVDRLRDMAKDAALLGVLAIADETRLFAYMAHRAPLTLEQLAEGIGLVPAHLEDALGALTAAGILEYTPETRTYALPVENAAVLADDQSPFAAAAIAPFMLALLEAVPLVTTSFTEGTGVACSRYGDDLVRGFHRLNSPAFRALLVDFWLPSVPGVVEKLEDGGRVLDLGCGTGTSTRLMASRFPRSHFLGVDLDPRAIARANEETAYEATANVGFEVGDVASLDLNKPLDLVTAFGVIHNLPKPVEALARLRGALTQDGALLIMQPEAADALEENLDDRGAMLYALSTLYTVPMSMAQGGASCGAWGPRKTEAVCRAAGFGRIERLPIQHPLNVFYLVRQQ